MNLARELIVQAKEAGADCVKFQSWTKSSVFARLKYKDNYFIDDDYRDRDMRGPYLICFLDGDSTNHSLDNLHLLCCCLE